MPLPLVWQPSGREPANLPLGISPPSRSGIKRSWVLMQGYVEPSVGRLPALWHSPSYENSLTSVVSNWI